MPCRSTSVSRVQKIPIRISSKVLRWVSSCVCNPTARSRSWATASMCTSRPRMRVRLASSSPSPSPSIFGRISNVQPGAREHPDHLLGAEPPVVVGQHAGAILAAEGGRLGRAA